MSLELSEGQRSCVEWSLTVERKQRERLGSCRRVWLCASGGYGCLTQVGGSSTCWLVVDGVC